MKQQFFPQRLFMDMKRLIINRLVGLGLLVVGALVSCNAPTAFVPVPSPNPWMDDYTALSSMENYKQWGTYNVHDPACKKIGDTYYMYSTDAIFAENRKEAEEKRKIAKETKLKMKINENKGKITDIYEEIGKKVYEKHVREENIDIKADLEEECKKLDELSKEIEEARIEILKLNQKKLYSFSFFLLFRFDICFF